MKKVLLVLIIALLSIACSSNKYKEQLDKLNAKLPQGTENVRVDKIEVEGDVFKCYYTILADIPDPTEEELEMSKTMLVETVKSDPEWKVFRDDNLHFCFIYKKQNNNSGWEVKISPEDYH